MGFDFRKEVIPREQALFGLVFIAVIVLFFRMVYTPNAVRLIDLRQRVANLQMEKAALEKFQLSTPKIRPSVTPSKNIQARVLSGDILSEFHDVTALLSKVTEPSFRGDLAVGSFNYLAPVVTDSPIQTVDFVLKSHGQFSSLLEYIQRLEQFPAVFKIKDVSLEMNRTDHQVFGEIGGRFFEIHPVVKGSASSPAAKK